MSEIGNVLKDISEVIRWIVDIRKEGYIPPNYYKLAIESLNALKKSSEHLIKYYKGLEINSGLKIKEV